MADFPWRGIGRISPGGELAGFPLDREWWDFPWRDSGRISPGG